jgi:hypothetical protein
MKTRIIKIFWMIPIFIFLFYFFWSLNLTFPNIGTDFSYFISHIEAGKLHFSLHGLFPFRFTPDFCGGMPQYGNPHDIYYSLIQLLSFFLDTWLSIQIGITAALLVGYFGWYRFGLDVIFLPKKWAHLLSFVILTNGFYFMHMIVGHVAYHTIPLIGLLLWILLKDSKETGRSLVAKAGLFSLIVAYIFYASGYFVLFITACALVLAVPIILIIHALHGRNMRSLILTFNARWYICGVAAILVCLSKLIAIYSLMQFFPRFGPFDQFLVDFPTYVIRAFWAMPQEMRLFLPAAIWGVHEYSMLLSPITLLGLLFGIPLLVDSKTFWKKKWILALALCLYIIFLALFFEQFVRGQGMLINPLKRLPIFSSWHLNVRFLYIPSLAFSILSIWCIEKFMRLLNAKNYEIVIIIASYAITIIALIFAYHFLLYSNDLNRGTNYYEFQMANDLKFHDTSMTKSVNTCEDPVYIGGGKVRIKPLSSAPAHMIERGFFNLYNPACLQYPMENNCSPGDRISEEDVVNFEMFRSRESTTWKISRAQMLSDWLSLFMIIWSIVCISHHWKHL